MKLLSIIIALLLLPVFCVFAQQDNKSQLISSDGNGSTPVLPARLFNGQEDVPIFFPQKKIRNLYRPGTLLIQFQPSVTLYLKLAGEENSSWAEITGRNGKHRFGFRCLTWVQKKED
jgi:hypothetical protein